MRTAQILGFIGLSTWTGCAPSYKPPSDLTLPWSTELAESSPADGLYGRYARSLLGAERRRSCQMVANPSFATPHAIFVVEPLRGTAEAHVTIKISESKVEAHAAPIPAITARRLVRVCETMIDRAVQQPAKLRDGTRYHVAALAHTGTYKYAVTHSPSFRSDAREFVHMMQSLRDYVLVPEPMRLTHLRELEETIDGLENELGLANVPLSGPIDGSGRNRVVRDAHR